MRGVAADILWMKANSFQMKKDWTNLSATLEQITKVEPNFIGTWRYQGLELVLQRLRLLRRLTGDKYYWVIRGIRFLQDGVRHNEREPRLLWDIGWFISYKIGRADERRQYRRLFTARRRLQRLPPLELRDNWLVGKTWYKKAEDLVARLPEHLVQGTSMVLFYHHSPMCQMDYADALEKDGVFGEKARLAWQVAGKEWFDFGAMEIPSPIEGEAVSVSTRRKNSTKRRTS